MNYGTPFLQHLNAFNQILSDMLIPEVKLKEGNTMMLLSSLPLSYDHLASTIMYEKDTLELKNIRQMLRTMS